MADYIPPTDAGFSDWLLNFSTLLTAAPATYGLAAPDAVAVDAENTAYQAAYIAAIDPGTRTSVTVAAKDAARASAEAVVRPFAVAISQNAAVLNDDKVAIGVTVRSTTPTPIPAPVVAPTLSLISAIIGQAQVQAKQGASTSKAKPEGCIAIEVRRSIGVVAATDPAQLVTYGDFGKTPFLVGFGAEDRGKVCTLSARYKTRSGPAGKAQSGPWSELLSFTVL